MRVDLIKDLSKKTGDDLEDPEKSTALATVTSGIKFSVRKQTINLSNQARYSQSMYIKFARDVIVNPPESA